uniref:M-phase phosphoprotein 6 n=2 Tax=Pomacentridae TaxID=30863 RepID=A0A3Q1G947_9TELE
VMAGDSVKLSKNLLRMKFMQRGLDAETKKQLEEDEKRIISDEHWFLDLPELRARENLIIEEKSFVPCEDLRFGRISFKGFNPEVEVRPFVIPYLSLIIIYHLLSIICYF